jgi:predicted RNA-binding Zn ribbon-like protein
MSRDPARAATQFFGGRVCLDFANTLDWRLTDDPQELITDYGALLAWCAGRGILLATAVTKLRARASTDTAGAQAVLKEARSLRAEIWSVADASLEGRTIDLTAVNRRLHGLPPQPRLVERGGVYVYDLKGHHLAEPLWPVLWSLTAVLASDDAERIGSCQAEGCGWYFVDESPNRTRLWCSSEVCGNRERARRAYAKRVAASDVRFVRSKRARERLRGPSRSPD